MLREWVVAGVWPFSLRQFWTFCLSAGLEFSNVLGSLKTNCPKNQSRLKKRIEEVEKYKKNLDLMLNSDKALYLNTFRAIFGTLLFMCVGAIVTTLRHSEMLAVARPESPGALAMLDMAAIMMFALAIAVALSSVTITIAEDNKQKFAVQSEKYGKEIENLKMILKAQLDKLGPRS